MVGIVIALVALLGIIMLLRVALRRFHGSTPDADVPEERRSVWSWADILAPLRRQPHSAVGVDETVDAVRAAYRRFLTLAAFHGQARQFTETPLEYRQRLQRQSLVDSEAIAALTERYQRVRYGPDGATADDARCGRGSTRTIAARAPDAQQGGRTACAVVTYASDSASHAAAVTAPPGIDHAGAWYHRQ